MSTRKPFRKLGSVTYEHTNIYVLCDDLIRHLPSTAVYKRRNFCLEKVQEGRKWGNNSTPMLLLTLDRLGDTHAGNKRQHKTNQLHHKYWQGLELYYMEEYIRLAVCVWYGRYTAQAGSTKLIFSVVFIISILQPPVKYSQLPTIFIG